jgi:antitoxin component YwqK of YwqJK toxin-antitoxin module
MILNSQNNHPLIVYYRNIRHIYIRNNIYVCGKINNNINHYKIKVDNISYKFYFANNIIYCIFITGNILIRKIVYYPGTNIPRIDTSYYKSGIKHGITQTYYPNGNPQMIAEYNNGQYIRDYLYYNRDGSLYKRIKK